MGRYVPIERADGTAEKYWTKVPYAPRPWCAMIKPIQLEPTTFNRRKTKHKQSTQTDPMKKLLTLTSIASIGAALALLAACQTTGTGDVVAQKESLLAQAGFKAKTVTTPKQQQRVSQLPPDVVSAVKYQGKLYYVYPTAKKDQIYVGKQAQYNAYKQALKAKIISQQPQAASQSAQQQQQMLNGSPVWSGETAGPRHVQIQVFDGFGPLDPMQGD